MSIKCITTFIGNTDYIKSTANRMIASKDAFKQAFASADILRAGSDDESIYPTYTRLGVYAYKVNDMEPGGAVAESTVPADDKKWETVTSKYRSPIFRYDDYMQMLDDLEGAGLITADEKAIVVSHATAVIGEKRNNYDIQDGKLGDDRIPATLSTIYFDELISDLSNDNREISGIDTKSEPRVFLESFYNKAKSAEMTKDEKWEAITSKCAGKPLSLHDYTEMLCVIANADLITFKEFCDACGHAETVVHDKVIDYDLQDGELWNDEISASLYLIDFDELFSDLSNENRIYVGFTKENDPRPFLNTFYQKIFGYFPKNEK